MQDEAMSPADRDTLYQISTLDSLIAGNYDGIETAAQVLAKGDFGIGTFEGLDGEMVALDGVIYQVKATGAVEEPDEDIMIPFSSVTYFDMDTIYDVGQVDDLDALKALLDPMIVKKDRFYAIRLDGDFSAIKVRSVPKQEKPYPVLSEVTSSQPVFDYQDVSGTLVGFWCPDYVGSVNVPGYHLHFISDDRTLGGHLLEISFADAKVMIDETRFFSMTLAEDAAQEGDILDAQKEIDKVEK
jgi:acetolactate decarboxylase